MQNGVKERYDNFSLHYCLNAQDGAKAYRVAYPNCKSGHAQSANKLLSIAYVKDKIRQIMADLAVKAEVTLEEVVKNARCQVKIGMTRGSAADIKGGNDQLGRIAGVYIDKTQEIASEEAEVLTENQAIEAQVLVKLRYKYGDEIKREIIRLREGA